MDEAQLKDTKDGSTSTSFGGSIPSGRRDTAQCVVEDTSNFHSVGVQRPLLDQCLQFLSSADHFTLTALGGVVLATAYVFLGRLGLVLFGVLAGIGLHASWEVYKESGDESVKANLSIRRRELGIEVTNRLLSWKESRITDKTNKQTNPTDISTTRLDYSDFQPATAAALNSLTDAIIRDYVRWWYEPILPSEQMFPQSCRSSITQFIISISSHLSRKRPADIFLHFVTNASSIVVVFLNELSSALESLSTASISTTDAISSYLSKYPESNLANVLSINQQRAKLRLVASDILQTFLEPSLYKCEPAKIFLQEIFAGVILESIIDNCSKPEWINGWIVQLLEEGEPELMNAIDIGVDRARRDQLQAFTGGRSLADNSNIPENSMNKEIVFGSSRTCQENHGLNKAQIEMEEAVREAKRLSAMIAVDGTRRNNEQLPTSGSEDDGDASMDCISSKPSELEVTASRGHGNWNSNVIARSGASRSSNEHGDTRKTINEFRLKQEDSIQMILLGASVSIFDDSFANDKGRMRVKPTDDYLLQIEPASSRHPGWVIARKYSDFEVLHEVLRRISVVSGVSDFVEQHKELPTWRGQYKPDLQQSLERYLQHALGFERLAGCEAMKRFLEKQQRDAQSSPSGTGKAGFSFPNQAVFENMGKGVLEVLSNAPKGVAGGGKAVLEGVTGVFGASSNIGKRSVDLAPREKIDPKPGMPPAEFLSKLEVSQNVHKTENAKSPQHSDTEDYVCPEPGSSENVSEKSVAQATHNQEENSAFKRPVAGQISRSLATEQISDNQENEPIASKIHLHETKRVSPLLPGQGSHAEGYGAVQPEPDIESPKSPFNHYLNEAKGLPLSEEETGVAVELLFAVINELYALSSAWGIRKKLLNAAKSFLLRPGNPNIEAIRLLVQESIIESNASDDALAAHITVLRQNVLPTEDELKLWPPALTCDEEKELRIKARKLLVTRGMPQALTSIMGNAATAEALGHVFDSLQVASVARGFIFALMLQALKAVIQ
ncbi:hypothetical protein AJ78_03377 [Emergomyces pasteurianus Ep9510]|uniref:PXA domain-containing protein n=1 Tax=Emergomyces pasteurianus Ep9510 TaxID=1447872 RepID=A0A1J9QKM7_9EURO|nr:hypothetical protein AJ78_03377 [Emergomyces pasteurianus Ep9510]